MSGELQRGRHFPTPLWETGNESSLQRVIPPVRDQKKGLVPALGPQRLHSGSLLGPRYRASVTSCCGQPSSFHQQSDTQSQGVWKLVSPMPTWGEGAPRIEIWAVVFWTVGGEACVLSEGRAGAQTGTRNEKAWP